jgi:predicted lysophospholipase L1 biosynthesis ABC-type transport system permease subunit
MKNKIIAGQWFDHKDPYQVSTESGIMKSLGLRLGMSLSFRCCWTNFECKDYFYSKN